MSKRDANEIQKEFTQACAELGQLEYQLSLMRKDLSTGNDRKNTITQKIEALNKEFATLRQAEANKGEVSPSDVVGGKDAIAS